MELGVGFLGVHNSRTVLVRVRHGNEKKAKKEMADPNFVERLWKPAQPLIDKIDSVSAEYPVDVQMVALVLKLLEYEFNGAPIHPDLLCAMIHDINNARDENV